MCLYSNSIFLSYRKCRQRFLTFFVQTSYNFTNVSLTLRRINYICYQAKHTKITNRSFEQLGANHYQLLLMYKLESTARVCNSIRSTLHLLPIIKVKRLLLLSKAHAKNEYIALYASAASRWEWVLKYARIKGWVQNAWTYKVGFTALPITLGRCSLQQISITV